MMVREFISLLPEATLFVSTFQHHIIIWRSMNNEASNRLIAFASQQLSSQTQRQTESHTKPIVSSCLDHTNSDNINSESNPD